MTFDGFDYGSIGYGLVALTVFVVAWATFRDTRARNLLQSALDLVEPLKVRVADIEVELYTLKRRIADLEYENADLWRWGRINYGKVVELNGDPEPVPILIK